MRANFKGPRDFVWTALAPLSYYAFVWQHGYISPRPFVDYYSTGEAACEWCGNSHQLTLHGCLADCKGVVDWRELVLGAYPPAWLPTIKMWWVRAPLAKGRWRSVTS